MTAPDQASPAGQDTPPTCYRHPGRETWVSCVRCGRHACPDCLRDAAVGQQCVECVRGAGQGGQRARAARTVFGGRPSRSADRDLDPGRPQRRCCSSSSWPSRACAYDWGMLGYAPFTPAAPVQGVAAGQWYRLITSAFLPPGTGLGGLGFLDIAFNMWALSWWDRASSRLLGRVRFLAVYLLSAVGGSVLLLLPGAADVLAARRLAARSSACSAPGSWSPGSCASTCRGIVTADRDQPGVQPLLPQHDRLAGPRGRADRGRADHRRLRLRAAQEPDAIQVARRPSRSLVMLVDAVVIQDRSSSPPSAASATWWRAPRRPRSARNRRPGSSRRARASTGMSACVT